MVMKTKFPIRVRRGSVVVTIFHQQAAGVFTVAYYENGKRKRTSFGDLTKAREEAERAAHRRGAHYRGFLRNASPHDHRPRGEPARRGDRQCRPSCLGVFCREECRPTVGCASRLLSGDQRRMERLVFVPDERAVQIVPLPVVHRAPRLFASGKKGDSPLFLRKKGAVPFFRM